MFRDGGELDEVVGRVKAACGSGGGEPGTGEFLSVGGIPAGDGTGGFGLVGFGLEDWGAGSGTDGEVEGIYGGRLGSTMTSAEERGVRPFVILRCAVASSISRVGGACWVVARRVAR